MKHTQAPWHPVQYANYFNIQDEPGYEGNNLLDIEVCPDAEANANVMAAGPELVEQLIEAKNLIRGWHGMGMDKTQEEQMWAIYENKSPEMKKINDVIKKATEYGKF